MRSRETIRESFTTTEVQEYVDITKIEAWNTEKYRVEQHGDKPTFVILGEFHGDAAQQKKQLELIELLQPEYVLHELLHGYTYDPQTKQFLGRADRKYAPLDANNFDTLIEIFVPQFLIDASNKYGFKIVGCDVTEAEIVEHGKKLASTLPDQFSFNEEKQTAETKRWFQESGGYFGYTEAELANYRRLAQERPQEWRFDETTKTVSRLMTDNSRRVSDEMMVFRDEKIAAAAAEYKGKSAKPIVVIMGSMHEQALVDRHLLGEGIEYVSINQEIVNGEPVEGFSLEEYREIQKTGMELKEALEDKARSA